jgi:anti-anti-sigma factor
VHRIQTEHRANVAVVIAEGELDAFVAPDLTSTFELLRGERLLVLDIGRVSFMDSTALGLVARFVRTTREEGAEIRVVLPKGTARRIFEITTLDTALPVAPSRGHALAELGAGTTSS